MINLLPPQQKESYHYGRINVTLVRYVVLVITIGLIINAILLTGSFFLNKNYANSQKNIEEYKGTISELETINDDAKSLSASIKTISSLLDQEILFSELLTEIGAVLPDGVVLRDLQLSDDRTAPLSLEVDAESPEAVGKFQLNLSESELFEGADITIVERSDSTSKYPYGASLNAYFTQTGDED